MKEWRLCRECGQSWDLTWRRKDAVERKSAARTCGTAEVCLGEFRKSWYYLHFEEPRFQWVEVHAADERSHKLAGNKQQHSKLIWASKLLKFFLQ